MPRNGLAAVELRFREQPSFSPMHKSTDFSVAVGDRLMGREVSMFLGRYSGQFGRSLRIWIQRPLSIDAVSRACTVNRGLQRTDGNAVKEGLNVFHGLGEVAPVVAGGHVAQVGRG